VVISDNRAIQDYVSDEYGVESVLIEYGGDHAKDIEIESDIAELYPFLYEDYSVNVCRVEPENNIHIVLEAFARMPSEKLVILGNWNNSNYGRKLKEKYQHHDNLILLPPIFDQHILGMIRSNCRIYVHPHSVGGTNPTLVEAMNTGLPIVGYDVIYNRETTENKALYFDSVESLVKIISEFNSEHGKNVGLNMLEIAKARYSWDIISKKYSDLF
jgi:glycosyltransferase involved in cell wall biosynthesis